MVINALMGSLGFVDTECQLAIFAAIRWPIATVSHARKGGDKEVAVAATSRNVKSMLKSRKLQSRKTRAFMVNVAAFDGGHVVSDKKRGQKKRNFQLARKLMSDYILPE